MFFKFVLSFFKLSSYCTISDEFEEAEIEETEDGVRTKSIFVKIPLQGNSPAETILYKSFNERELTMFIDVLPKLQTFLDERYFDVVLFYPYIYLH